MKTHTNFPAAITKQCCFFLGAILLCSCTHVYYSPNSSNVPLFEKKGEFRLSGNYCVGSTVSDEITGGEIQAAYAAGDHLGILLNTAFMGGREEDNTQGHSSGSGSIIEMGAGYFKPLKKSHVFETYAGFGFGNVKNNYLSGGNSRVNFTKFFLQPSIGYSKKYFHVGIASKLSFVIMKVDLPNGHNLIEPYDMGDIAYITEKPLSVLWEPSFFIRAGVKAVKAQFQFTPSVNLNNKQLAQNGVLLSMGIIIAIDPGHIGK
ncbi:MAG TPA: hypothetical protein VFV68_10090 [Agriterribacter sp.]|nr:hypothetical protein [Agriterribacter sp.]